MCFTAANVDTYPVVPERRALSAGSRRWGLKGCKIARADYMAQSGVSRLDEWHVVHFTVYDDAFFGRQVLCVKVVGTFLLVAKFRLFFSVDCTFACLWR